MLNKVNSTKKVRSIEVCDIEVYFDEEIGHNVTLIKDGHNWLSPTRQRANLSAKYLGFEDVWHREGYLHFNRLFNEQYSGFETEIDGLHENSNCN